MPSANCCFFCLFQCFAEKEYQTESKRNETFTRIFFWNKRNPGDLEWRSRKQRGGHEVGRRAQGGRRAPTLVAPSWLHGPTSFAYIYSYTLKTSWEPRNHFCTATTFCTREIPSWGLFRYSTEGGFDHEGPLHQP